MSPAWNSAWTDRWSTPWARSMTRIPDLERVADLIATIAAEEMTPRFRRLASHDIRAKDDAGDLVTIVDEICERRLTEALSTLLPGSLVVGEEATAADPKTLARLSQDQPVWLIDPLDGTRNFARGEPEFASMVALVERDTILAAWIHDPLAGLTAMAERGQGAWQGGKRLSVADPKPIGQRRGAFNIPSSGPRKRAASALATAIEHRHRITCAGRSYLDLATGALDLAIFRKLKPWDHAPGVLIHAEAGGVSGLLADATAYRPSLEMGPMLVTTDQAAWHDVSALLTPDII